MSTPALASFAIFQFLWTWNDYLIANTMIGNNPDHAPTTVRIANLAGFEGSTKIYLNTISPAGVRDRVVPALRRLQDEGRLAPGIRL